MTIPKLSEAILRRYANPQSFQRGEDYYHQGAVHSLTQRGSIILAKVEGNQPLPYHVSIQFEGNEITRACCNCPYDFDGWCKHIVATLLTCVRQPVKIEQRPTLETLLDRLNEVQTQALIQELVAEHPELLDTIERLVNRLAPSIIEPQPSQPPRKTTLDTAPYRSQVRRILRDAARYLEEGTEDDPIPEELYDIIHEAQIFTEKGDGNNAIAILEAITQTCVENWDEVEEYGADNDEVAQTLNEIWTEAILVAQLSSSEKAKLQSNLESWQDEWNADLTMSLEALRQGWDYPPLPEILQGEISQSVWEEEAPYYAQDLALIRLKILETQKRYPEYLYLAQAEGQSEQYLLMLARLDRIDAVMEAADEQLTSMESAFALAQVLLGQGATHQALAIGQRGLILPGNCGYELANWTSELAQDLEVEDIALAAKIKAFQAKPCFTDYRKIETLAGEDWDILKQDLLDYLGSYKSWGLGIEEAKVNIFLHEGLVDEAIAIVDNFGSYNWEIIHQVMEVAISKRPDWVIENAKRRAESIMDAKKAQYYDQAIEWLRKAKAAYCQAGREAEWSAYRAQLMKIHALKRKLMGLLKQLS